MAGSGTAHLRENSILRVENLVMEFPVKGTRQRVQAVSNISFDVADGETLGLVGESGCGKSTTGKAIMQLPAPTSGSVTFDGTNLTALKGEALRATRPKLQMIFQDPYASLNPRMTVGEILAEPMAVHDLYTEAERGKRVRELLDVVGLLPEHARRYPHQFSGGQRQRIGIARALAVNPDLIICDEPVSALDVSIQAQVLNLFMDLRDELGLEFTLERADVVSGSAPRVEVRGSVREGAQLRKVLGPDHIATVPRKGYRLATAATPLAAPAATPPLASKERSCSWGARASLACSAASSRFASGPATMMALRCHRLLRLKLRCSSWGGTRSSRSSKAAVQPCRKVRWEYGPEAAPAIDVALPLEQPQQELALGDTEAA